ncbi:GNAT family N-acetyltransferase [Paenibacillus gorillae]|uniref:GNAT family N-acetyltransferase n=2 Tax=Bacillota TaxID=1239 RepID=UPI0004B8E286|nr:GNAT family N-acetyltransferase [Paenibacillus gorillae]
METNLWSERTQIYKLTDEYSIQRAEVDEWGIYCSIYYNASYNGFFREELYNRARNNAFWIYKGEMKIGGVRMAPNLIYHLFFIPPFRHEFEVLKQLKMILIQWSDRANPIKTFEVLPDQVPLYAKAGFWPDEFRCRWMQRPTDYFEIKWDSNVIIQSPQIEDNDAKSGKRFTNEDEIAHCDFHSFQGGFEAVRRNKASLADFVPNEDPNLTNERLLQASTLVYDRESGD